MGFFRWFFVFFWVGFFGWVFLVGFFNANPGLQVARQPDNVQKACTAISKLLVSNIETTLPRWKPTEGRNLPSRMTDSRPQPFHGRVYCLLPTSLLGVLDTNHYHHLRSKTQMITWYSSRSQKKVTGAGQVSSQVEWWLSWVSSR